MFDRTISKSQIWRRRCRFIIWLYHYRCLTEQFQSPKFGVAVAVLLYGCIIINVWQNNFKVPNLASPFPFYYIVVSLVWQNNFKVPKWASQLPFYYLVSLVWQNNFKVPNLASPLPFYYMVNNNNNCVLPGLICPTELWHPGTAQE